MNAIEFERVDKRFRRRALLRNYDTLKSLVSVGRRTEPPEPVEALRDVSFAVERGESLGIVGANGAGKSTILKLIAGIYQPNGGAVRVHGRVASLIELGIGFHPDFSGLENVRVSCLLHGLTRRETRERIDAIVDFAELRDRMEDPVRTYSSGMYLRLGFSVAIHCDPEILIVDEVLTVGDEAFEKKCFDRIRSFQAGGGTMLLVTHDLGLVRDWCRRALWLDSGRVQGLGPPDEVIARYRAAVGP